MALMAADLADALAKVVAGVEGAAYWSAKGASRRRTLELWRHGSGVWRGETAGRAEGMGSKPGLPCWPHQWKWLGVALLLGLFNEQSGNWYIHVKSRVYIWYLPIADQPLSPTLLLVERAGVGAYLFSVLAHHFPSGSPTLLNFSSVYAPLWTQSLGFEIRQPQFQIWPCHSRLLWFWTSPCLCKGILTSTSLSGWEDKMHKVSIQWWLFIINYILLNIQFFLLIMPLPF